MSNPSPSDRFVALFAPWMAERGFSYRKKGHVFRRPFAAGHQEFVLDFDGRGGFVTVTSRFYIYFDELVDRQVRLGLPAWQAAKSLDDFTKKYWYDLYLDEYMNMTPMQRKGITSETTHPQERIEEGVRFLQDAFIRYAEPMFEWLLTPRQLADAYRAHLFACGPAPTLHPTYVVPMALLVADHLAEESTDLVEASRQRGGRSDAHQATLSAVLADIGAPGTVC